MKKLATCLIASIGLIGTPAFAADMGVPAAPPPAPVYNWTGWYVGVNAGASMGTVKTDFNRGPVTVTIDGHPGSSPSLDLSNTESPDGFIGGGQIGYNYQLSPIWVVGVEADFQGAAEKDSNTLTNPFEHHPDGFLATGTTVTDYATKIEWFGTARLRAGYVWGNGNVFSYVTGGLAYGKVDLEGTSTVSGSVCGQTAGVCTTLSTPFSISHALGHSHVNTGWVLGYGPEGRMATPGWTWKIEGLYMDLGHLDTTGVTTNASITGACAGICVLTGGQVSTHSHFPDGILRGGLNYQFH
jgi:outer membrane immunogenic protein